MNAFGLRCNIMFNERCGFLPFRNRFFIYSAGTALEFRVAAFIANDPNIYVTSSQKKKRFNHQFTINRNQLDPSSVTKTLTRALLDSFIYCALLNNIVATVIIIMIGAGNWDGYLTGNSSPMTSACWLTFRPLFPSQLISELSKQ